MVSYAGGTAVSCILPCIGTMCVSLRVIGVMCYRILVRDLNAFSIRMATLWVERELVVCGGPRPGGTRQETRHLTMGVHAQVSAPPFHSATQ